MAMQDGLDGKVLAEELLALESQFRSSSMNPMGGTKMANDWTVTIDGGSGRYSCTLSTFKGQGRDGVWEGGVRVRKREGCWGGGKGQERGGRVLGSGMGRGVRGGA